MNTLTRAEVVDPITAEVIRNKLEGIANEMELTLLQKLVLADREGRARYLRQPLHGERRDARAGVRDSGASRDADPRARGR